MTFRGQIDAAVARGIEFVLAAQNADSAWTDWSLPPGRSPEWTTADVGRRLAGLAAPHRAPLAVSLGRAARWLASRQDDRGGWGYSTSVEPDADSTAQALLFLAAVGEPCAHEAYAFLSRHQRSDGGFATFLPSPLTGSWGLSHAEATPIALLALRTSPTELREHARARGVSWILDARRPDGLWNSFWWSTPLAATEVSLELFEALGVAGLAPPALLQWIPADALEGALLLSIIARDGPSPRLDKLTRELIAQQTDDGSWCGAPSLRIPSRDCDRPWENSQGHLYSDGGHLHTTVTALAAISAAWRVTGS